MGKRGPAPQPTALKKLRGNPGKRKLNSAEPQPHIGSRTPSVPDWLSDGARDIWHRYARTLWELQLLTEIDVLAFGAFCEWMALYIKAMGRINDGYVDQTTESGYRAQDPWVSIASNAWNHASKIMGLFGMTPSDRSKLRIEEVEKELSLAEELFAITNHLEEKEG